MLCEAGLYWLVGHLKIKISQPCHSVLDTESSGFLFCALLLQAIFNIVAYCSGSLSRDWRVTFSCLAKKKVTKKKATPYRLFPALLSFMGVNRKLANKIIWLKQPLAENSHEAE